MRFTDVLDKLSLLQIVLSLSNPIKMPQKGWGAVTTFLPRSLHAQLSSPLSADASTHLQETVISTLVAGMLPVIGSKSYTDDMSSSLSITSPSIISIARSRGGSGLIRESHSLALTERVESPVTPETRSETRRPPVRPGEAATSQMLKLERNEGGRKGRGAH